MVRVFYDKGDIRRNFIYNKPIKEVLKEFSNYNVIKIGCLYAVVGIDFHLGIIDLE